MIPVMIQDYIDKLLDETTHTERRQFYYETLRKINEKISMSLHIYETRKKEAKR
jgi:hypothetical protein